MIALEAMLESVGRAIRLERKRQGRSLSDLAERSLLDPAHVSKIERGCLSFSVETLARLAKGLDVSSMFLLCPEDRPLRDLLRTPEPALAERELVELITLGLTGAVIYRDGPKLGSLQNLTRALLQDETLSPTSRAVLESWLVEENPSALLRSS